MHVNARHGSHHHGVVITVACIDMHVDAKHGCHHHGMVITTWSLTLTCKTMVMHVGRHHGMLITVVAFTCKALHACYHFFMNFIALLQVWLFPNNNIESLPDMVHIIPSI
jgi:hypothetical protein